MIERRTKQEVRHEGQSCARTVPPKEQRPLTTEELAQEARLLEHAANANQVVHTKAILSGIDNGTDDARIPLGHLLGLVLQVGREATGILLKISTYPTSPMPITHRIPSRTVSLAGASIRRVLPHHTLRKVGPWVFLDHFGPLESTASMDIGPHPHCGLSTVSYLFEGSIEHRDSTGGHAIVQPGEIHW